jgi:hypothetical protein
MGIARWLAFAASAAAAFGATAMEGDEPLVTMDEVCVLLACRPPTHVHLEGSAGHAPVSMDFQKSPYIFHGVVSVLPGESLMMEGNPSEDDLANLHYVKDVADPKHTLVVSFRQIVEQGRARMLLSIANPFDRPVLYRAALMLPGKRMPEDRTACAVKAGGQRIESWPEPVVQLFLIDLHFATDAEIRPCE